MSALRKAGVWLGLVEEDDERAYDDAFDDDFGDEDEFVPPRRGRCPDRPPARPRARAARRPERPTASSRRLATSASDRGSTTTAAERPGRRCPRPTASGSASGPRYGQCATAEPAVRRPSGACRSDRWQRRPTRRSPRPLPDRDHELPDPGQPGPGAAGPAARAGGGQRRVRAAATRSPRCTRPPTARRARSASTSATAYPVIMNLTEMDEADAKRLVDFAAGLAFGLRGTWSASPTGCSCSRRPTSRSPRRTRPKIAEGGFFDRT